MPTWILHMLGCHANEMRVLTPLVLVTPNPLYSVEW